MARQQSVRLSSMEKFGLSRTEAAAFVGFTLTKFDNLVATNEMPPARKVGGELRWVRIELERFLIDAPTNVPAPVRSVYERVGR